MNELRKNKCHTGDSDQVDRAADDDSELAHDLHLLHTACAAYSYSRSSGSNQGQGILRSMGKPSKFCFQEAVRTGRWCEVRQVVLAGYENETRQDARQLSRWWGWSPPNEFSEDRASRMVVVGSGGDHHAATHSCLGFISAPELFVAPGLPCLICSPAIGTRSRCPRFLVRSLHHLSASANSPHSQTADRERRAVSFNQRECCGHDCRRGLGRPQDFQQSFLSENTGVLAGRTSRVIGIRADSSGRSRAG